MRGIDEHRLENSCQYVALPDYDGPAPCLFPGPIVAEICPPDLSPLQSRSVASSELAHSARPSSERAISSWLEALSSRAKSHRRGSGRRITSRFTRSPERSSSCSTGLRTPFSYWASTNLTTIILPRVLSKIAPPSHRREIMQAPRERTRSRPNAVQLNRRHVFSQRRFWLNFRVAENDRRPRVNRAELARFNRDTFHIATQGL